MANVTYYLRNSLHTTPCVPDSPTYSMNLSPGSEGSSVSSAIPNTLYSNMFYWEVDVENVKNGAISIGMSLAIQNYVLYQGYVSLLEGCIPFQHYFFLGPEGYTPVTLDWGGRSGGTVRVVLQARKTVGSMTLNAGVTTGASSFITIPFIDGDVADGGVVCGGTATESMGESPGYADFDIHLRNPIANSFDIYFDELLPIIWYKTTPQGTQTLTDNIGDANGTLANYSDGYLTPWGAINNRYYLEFDPETDFYEPGSAGTHVVIPYTAIWDWPNGFTIMLWYKPRNLGVTDLGETTINLLNYGGTETDNIVCLSDTGFGYPHFSLWDDNEGSTFYVQSPNPSVVGVWHHIACVAENGFMGMYHNGVLVDSNTDLTTPINTVSGNRYLGVLNTSNFRSYVGYMSDIRIYDIPLSAGQIENIYEQEVLQRARQSPFDKLGDT